MPMFPFGLFPVLSSNSNSQWLELFGPFTRGRKYLNMPASGKSASRGKEKNHASWDLHWEAARDDPWGPTHNNQPSSHMSFCAQFSWNGHMYIMNVSRPRNINRSDACKDPKYGVLGRGHQRNRAILSVLSPTLFEVRNRVGQYSLQCNTVN